MDTDQPCTRESPSEPKRGRKPLPEDKIAQLRSARCEGRSLSELAKLFGLSLATVSRYVKDVETEVPVRLGRPPKSERPAAKCPAKRLSEADIARMRQHRASGASAKEVAKAAGVSMPTVFKYCGGLETDCRATRISAADRARMSSLRAQGWTFAAIAAECDVSIPTAMKYAHGGKKKPGRGRSKRRPGLPGKEK